MQLPSLANSATSRFVSHGRQFRLNDCVHCCTHASGPAQVIQKPREQVKRQAGGLALHLDELGVVADGGAQLAGLLRQGLDTDFALLAVKLHQASRRAVSR